jgi:hypothetical protein
LAGAIMSDLLPITLADMIAECERELAMRAVWYPKWKATASAERKRSMDYQTAVLLAILKKLENERDARVDH